MSVKVQGWVWDQSLPTSEKIVLLKLADHADHEGGNVYPSVASIAAQTGLSERQVQRYLKGFLEKGILVIDDRAAGGRGRTRVYRFTFEKGDAGDTVLPRQRVTSTTPIPTPETVTPMSPIAAERVTPMTRKGDMGDAKRVTPVTQKGDIHARANQNRHEPSPEPSGNRHGEAQAPRPSPKRATRLPEDFGLTDELLAWGEREGIDQAALEEQLAQFRDHFTGTGQTRVDWPATFRTWIRKARQWGHIAPKGATPVAANGRASVSQRNAAAFDQVRSAIRSLRTEPEGDVIDVTADTVPKGTQPGTPRAAERRAPAPVGGVSQARSSPGDDRRLPRGSPGGTAGARDRRDG